MKKLLLLFNLLMAAHFLQAQDLLKLVSFSSGYVTPLGIENCGDSRLFIVQKGGQIIICDSAGVKRSTPYLDISDRVLSTGGEQGLLGLAFDPDYTTNGYFYVNYINKSNSTQISRFKVTNGNENRANPNSERMILTVPQPYNNHKGGCIKFGKDGYLYIGLGDGGSAGDPENRAQNPALLLGKMLRIDVHKGNPYSIPADNPYVSVAGYSPEIWDMGLRNPWRFSFDALTGALVIADVGQDQWEEVDLERPGSKGGYNYGWRCYEGNHAYNTTGCSAQSAYTFPVYEYQHLAATNDCSIIGGYVYRGKKYPQAYGKYVYTDYCSGRFHSLSLTGNAITEDLLLNGDDYVYTSFGEDMNNELYVCNYTGTVYKLAVNGAPFAKQPQKLQNKQMAVYPNPSKGKFTVELKADAAANYKLTISNQLGLQVYTSEKYLQPGLNKWNVTVAGLKGNYLLTLNDKKGVVSTKQLVIQ